MKSVLFFLIAITTSFAFANAKVVGNGGQGVACSDSTGNLFSVNSLDLYEASIIHGLTPATYEGLSYSEILNLLGQRVAETQSISATFVQDDLKKIREKMQFLPSGVHLKPIEDSGDIPIITENCEIIQLANYLEDGTLLVDGDYWQKMDVRNRAALTLHEYIYKIMRYWSEKDSFYTRKVVAYLLSTEELVPIKQGLDAKRYFYCKDTESRKYEFYITPSSIDTDSLATFQFYAFDGKLRFSRMSITTNLRFSEFIHPATSSSRAGQDYGVVQSKISEGRTLWWRYQTGDFTGNTYVKLFFAVTKDEPPTDTDFTEITCGQLH
ncbi:hypothetical protein AZI86_13045 [Bdellovibrio bacteriovorus]|uniref:Uncharacterized protein n=1 Tax=Bdellovibrio bacteriovorus TaxID=959 RepID=A0A150WJJ3_BDEBC|nr:hypothetical protein [Bdellovibrio bacteriovorus]KYG63745.1 hypothetical protein AZI86_13045 [Bdellovibrio bacteriovorus]